MIRTAGRTSITFTVGATILLAYAGIAVVAQTAATNDLKVDTKNSQDRARIERELRDLQEQRAKIDSRIRELRAQAGKEGLRSYTFSDGAGKVQALTPGAHSFFFSDGNLKEMKELTPEQRKKVEEAMAEAHKALEKAKKELPEGFVMPDIESLINNAMRLRTLQPGGAYVGPGAFDSKEFREQMEKMRDSIRSNVQTYRSQAIPRVYATPTPRTLTVPATPLFREGSRDIRNEIRELRREIEQLREEMRRDRGGKRESPDRKTQVTDPFGGSL